jgi:hypothetical protein
MDLLEQVTEVLKNHFVQGILLALVGLLAGWLLGHWRRYRLLRQVQGGDAREVVAIEQILIKDHADGTVTMRIRSAGSAPLREVLPNPVVYEAFLQRAMGTKPTNPLISMAGQMGSYLLYLLTPWVCGMVRQGPFKHDAWVMAPVCEPGVLSAHQSSTIILIRRTDLERFLDWEQCKDMHVEHGSDGARILTLWHMAREYHRQLADVQKAKSAGKPSTTIETMYLLDLGLDMEELALPTKPVSWSRFAAILKELKLS